MADIRISYPPKDTASGKYSLKLVQGRRKKPAPGKDVWSCVVAGSADSSVNFVTGTLTATTGEIIPGRMIFPSLPLPSIPAGTRWVWAICFSLTDHTKTYSLQVTGLTLSSSPSTQAGPPPGEVVFSFVARPAKERSVSAKGPRLLSVTPISPVADTTACANDFCPYGFYDPSAGDSPDIGMQLDVAPLGAIIGPDSLFLDPDDEFWCAQFTSLSGSPSPGTAYNYYVNGTLVCVVSLLDDSSAGC